MSTSTKKNTNTKSSSAKKGAKSVKSAGAAKPKLKINEGALAKSERAPSPGTLMRAHGHKLVQMWVSKQLQSAILDRARAKGVRISDVLRETVGKEAEKWSGAAVGSLQTLRFVGRSSGDGDGNGGDGNGGARVGKSGANTATKTNTKSKVVKPVKVQASVPSKSVAKSARKSSPRSSAARGGVKKGVDVGEAGVVAESGGVTAETAAE